MPETAKMWVTLSENEGILRLVHRIGNQLTSDRFVLER